MNATSHSDDFLDDLTAYALDALDDAERIALEAHLSTCPECRRIVAELQATANLLPYGLPEAAPRPELRGLILERVCRERQPEQAQPVQPVQQSKIIRPAFWRRPLPAWSTALAAAAAVAAIIWAGQLQGQVNQLQQQLASSQEQLDVSRRQLEERERLVALTLTAAPVAALAGEGPGSARLYRSGDEAVLVASLPPLPAGRVYQVWLLDGGAPRSAGTFSANSSGVGLLAISGVETLAQSQAIAITNEPQGGSAGPTTPVLLSGEIQS